ncbi:MAG: hypothetical protein WCW17_00855 [Patescibacteria group bacterium]|jgi:hypothetical protein
MDQSAVVPSWDLFITLFAIIIIAYGVIMAREKIIVTMVSAYVGLVVAKVWGTTIYDFFNGNKTILNKVWIRSSASLFLVQLVLFGIVIGVLSYKSGLSAKEGKGLSTIEYLVYSILASGLIISSIISFMPESQQLSVVESSRLGRLTMNYQTWWIILPIVLMVFTSGRRKNSGGE